MKFAAAAPEEQERLAGLLAAELARFPEVDFALGHGSFFAGLPSRDVDLALWLATPADDVRVTQIAIACSRRVGRPVDVSLLNDAGDGFRRAAARGRVVFARDVERAYGFVERQRIAGWDFAAMARQSAHDLLRR